VRIISGSLGGRVLRAPKGLSTRPTSDRVREAVFNILGARGPVPAAVLDLYAGSGALGLEALSRGAERAVFVEQHGPTARLIRDNASELGVDSRVDVRAQRVEDFLARATPQIFGWIFLDPPYADVAGLGRALGLVAPFCDEQTLVIAEHDGKLQPAESHAPATANAHGTLALCDRRRYGQCAVSFYSLEHQ